MAGIDDCLARLGIGGARLLLSLPVADFPRGCEVRGTLAVVGGKVPQRIQRLTVALTEFQNEGKTSPKEHALLLPACNITIRPEERREYPFAFRIPDNARLSNPKGGWRIDARADISWAVNPCARIPLRVVIHSEIIAVQEAMLKHGFTVNPWHIEITTTKTQATVVHYRPPDHLREQIDRASLSLIVEGAWVQGRLQLYRHGDSLVGHLKALTGSNLEEFTLIFQRATLLTSQGLPDPEGALSSLYGILADALILPDNARKWLLRGASEPLAGPDVLLRPARSAPAEAADELLRPQPDQDRS